MVGVRLAVESAAVGARLVKFNPERATRLGFASENGKGLTMQQTEHLRTAGDCGN
jgi:hypothetical protein